MGRSAIFYLLSSILYLRFVHRSLFIVQGAPMEPTTGAKKWQLSPDRCFDSDPAQRDLARQLYAIVRELPLLCPHGHVSPALLADPDTRLGSPADPVII